MYNIANELYRLLPSHIERKRILEEYKSIRQKLGDEVAPDNTAHLIIKLLIFFIVFRKILNKLIRFRFLKYILKFVTFMNLVKFLLIKKKTFKSLVIFSS